MARIKYNLGAFNAEEAANGALCVAVTAANGSKTYIYNIDTSGKSTSGFLGAGICRYFVPNRFMLTIGGVVYEFNEKGIGRSNTRANGYVLKLASVAAPSTVGSVVDSSSTTVITSRADGSIGDTSTTYGKSSKVVIDSLNARDEFAVHALRELLCHTKDPSVLSNNEMNFYCNTAYQWAANMMAASAEARNTYASSDGEDSDYISGGSLTTNTERLLSVLINTIQKPYSSEVKDGSTTYYENVKVADVNIKFKELIDLLSNYVKKDEGTIGLKDLIDAIKNIKIEGGEAATVDFTSLNTTLTNNTTNLTTAINTTKSMKLVSGSLGSSTSNPLYISGGGFPSRQLLAKSLVYQGFDATDTVHDFLTFNNSGAVGYSTNDEVSKVVANNSNTKSILLTYMANHLFELDGIGENVWTAVEEYVEQRIKDILSMTYVTVNGTKIYVNYPTD